LLAAALVRVWRWRFCRIDSSHTCAESAAECKAVDACSTAACTAADGCKQTPVDCSHLTTSCKTGLCDASKGGCTTVDVVCTTEDKCKTPKCVEGTGCTTDPITCKADDKCSTAGCDSKSGCTQTPITCEPREWGGGRAARVGAFSLFSPPA
jgi:hypothetical protein